MSVATPELQDLKTLNRDTPAPPAITVTENAAKAFQKILNQQRSDFLNEIDPDLAARFDAFLAEKGQAPTPAELGAAAGVSETALYERIGAAAFEKINTTGEQLPADLRDHLKQLKITLKRTPTLSELATAAGLSESETLAKIGKSSASVLGTNYLRLRTLGGGCSGMQDKLDIDPELTKRDVLFNFHGIPVVVDKISLLYVSGAKIDFHNELNRTGFSISNPNRKTTCGCGSSYSM